MKFLLVFALVLASLEKWPLVLNIPLLIILFVLILLLRIVMRNQSIIITVLSAILLSTSLATVQIKYHLYKIKTAISIDNNTPIQAKSLSLFDKNANKKSVLFAVYKKNDIFQYPNTFNARLYVPKNLPIKQGQIWQIKARFREPYGRVNEEGFDAEYYFLSRHIHSKGSVISAKLVEKNTSFRQEFYDYLSPTLLSFPTARFLIALSFGERSLLTKNDWEMLRNSGLAHLLAISGLHIGLAFFFGFHLFSFINTLIFRYQPKLYLPYFAGLFFAFFYSWLASFSLPTKRALIALTLFTLIRIAGFSMSPFSLLLIVCTVVLAFDPFAVFSTSFWLSFGAVLLLMCFFTLFHYSKNTDSSLSNSIWRFVKTSFLIQCFLVLAMLPIMAMHFNGISMTSIIFNLLAVPWVSMAVVPLILFSVVFSLFHVHVFWHLANAALLPLVEIMPYAKNHWLTLHQFSLLWLCLFSILLFLLAYKAWRMPAFICTLVLILVCWRNEKNTFKNWQADVLDVGHGLAVLISKNNKAILYDTGASWQTGSIAESVIYPMVQNRNMQLQEIILSHSDKDHAGGIDWLAKHYPNAKIRSVEPNKGFLPCFGKQEWRWQGLHFRVLYPLKPVHVAKNEDSCVIQVSDGKHKLLLTGDLLAKQEAFLTKQQTSLSSNLLIVPHHGSKSSSTKEFLQAVNPSAAIVSRGRYTPWNIPHPEVIKRYKDLEIDWYDTVQHGQVSVKFSERGWHIETMRFDISPYWYRTMFGDL